MIVKKAHVLSRTIKSKNKNDLATVRISDTILIRNIDVKREWIYAELVIEQINHPYLGKWEYKDSAVPATLGDEKLENLIIPIKKKKRDWDKAFWDAASMFSNPVYMKLKDMNKVWEATNILTKERLMTKTAREEEKAEETRILRHSW